MFACFNKSPLLFDFQSLTANLNQIRFSNLMMFQCYYMLGITLVGNLNENEITCIISNKYVHVCVCAVADFFLGSSECQT